MKIEIELHDSRKERPEKTGEVLVFHIDEVENEVYYSAKVNYSKKNDQFNNRDYNRKYDKFYGEEDGHHTMWAYWEDVQKAIKEAEKPVETCRERLKREHPECIDIEYLGGCSRCPINYGYAGVPDDCVTADDICTKCWDRPVEGKDNEWTKRKNRPAMSKCVRVAETESATVTSAFTATT